MAKRETSRKGWIRRIVGLLVTHAIVTVVLVAIAFLVGWGSLSRSLPDLNGWHEEAPASEFRASDAEGGYTFDDYLSQEEAVFRELGALVKAWEGEVEGTYSRYKPGSVCDPETILDRNWNRTFVLESEGAEGTGGGGGPVGGALLVHGLSDSPYSLRAAGRRLHEAGWTVIGLRVPGHGTCPRALAEASWRDWTAAVRVAMRGLRERVGEGVPLVLVGFSNGGALSVEYMASSLEEEGLPRVDGVVLFSPMIGITALAQITRLYHVVTLIPGFEKAAWQGISAEVDPFKYSSWPVGASEQAWLLTKHVEGMLARLDRAGRLDELTPVLAFQSAVDATVVVPRLISRLFDRLGAGSELVLFDVNRVGVLDDLIGRKFEHAIVPLLDRQDLGYALTVVTNTSPESLELVARRRVGEAYTEEGLALSWPRAVFSLSHGSPPIPPDDPVYGTEKATASTGLPLGSLSLRGETGVLRISESMMVRMRHNPFYEYVEGRMVGWLGEVVGSR